MEVRYPAHLKTRRRTAMWQNFAHEMWRSSGKFDSHVHLRIRRVSRRIRPNSTQVGVTSARCLWGGPFRNRSLHVRLLEPATLFPDQIAPFSEVCLYVDNRAQCPLVSVASWNRGARLSTPCLCIGGNVPIGKASSQSLHIFVRESREKLGRFCLASHRVWEFFFCDQFG